MSNRLKSAGMIAGMVLSWSVYYAVSKVMVNATGSAFLAGCHLYPDFAVDPVADDLPELPRHLFAVEHLFLKLIILQECAIR